MFPQRPVDDREVMLDAPRTSSAAFRRVARRQADLKALPRSGRHRPSEGPVDELVLAAGPGRLVPDEVAEEPRVVFSGVAWLEWRGRPLRRKRVRMRIGHAHDLRAGLPGPRRPSTSALFAPAGSTDGVVADGVP